jgi:outer membrane protein assembly factor BamB
VTDSFFTYTGASEWTVDVLCFDATTGTRKWSYRPAVTALASSNAPDTALRLSDDGATLFVVITPNSGSAMLAAVSTASGAILWTPVLYSRGSYFSGYYNVTLPALTFFGNPCVSQASFIKCFSASTGVERFSIPYSSGDTIGLDANRFYLIIMTTNSTTTLVNCYATSSGVLIWSSATPSGTRVAAAEMTLMTLYAVVSDEARNSASLYAWSLTDGRTPAGLPAVLPSSDYRNAIDMSVASSGALVITRLSSYDKGGASFALIDPGSGVQKWVATHPSYPYPVRPVVFSADGALAFASGACANIATTEPTCTKGAVLVAINIATGQLVTVAQPDAFLIIPLAPDKATGGVVAIYIQSLAAQSVASVGVASSGAVSWLAQTASFAGSHAPTRRIVLVTSPTLPSPTLSVATLPSPASPAGAALPKALIGGLVGGAGVLVIAAAAFVNRAALASLVQRARGGGEASALLGGARNSGAAGATAPYSTLPAPQPADDADAAPSAPPRFTRSFS